MKISVIIPTYKPQSYVWECLDSLENQTFSKEDFEVIVVLNGCDEPYRSQLESYIKTSALNYQFIHTEVGGVSNARNLAIANAKGEYIAFVDDDDLVSPAYLQELYGAADLDVIALSCPVAFRQDIDVPLPYGLSRVFMRYRGEGKVLFTKARKYFSGPCMKLIHRDIISDRRFDTSYKNGEDSLFMFLISDKVRYVQFTSEKAIYYRRYRDGSAYTSKQTWSYWMKNCLRLFADYSKIYIRHIFAYKFSFYLSRCLALVHTMISVSLNK